jgi:glutamate racemase
MVILACNTAAAYAVRSRQEQYPDKKVLSITIPGVEKILKDDNKKKI